MTRENYESAYECLYLVVDYLEFSLDRSTDNGDLSEA